VGKHCSNPKCLKKKNYKTKFLTNSILKKINSTKIILEKHYTKANYVEKHYINLKCLKKKKYKAKFLTILILKKINSTKKILEKKHVEKHCNKTKTMWRNTVAIQNV
jgi:hypothetical protein